MGSPVLIKQRYELKDVLGHGRSSVVYRAFDAQMHREVALKTIHHAAPSPQAQLFYRECNVLATLAHPNIVEILDMGEFAEEGVPKLYFVMPLLPGRTLDDLFYPGGQPLAIARSIGIVSQACRALHAAHECNILHGDIKPRNIFVMPDDAVKLADFGVVRLFDSESPGVPIALETLRYMAPEQIARQPLTPRSDLFSLAIVCYEALTGVHPFARESEAETVAAVSNHVPPLASILNPLVDSALAEAVAQAMEKNSQLRFPSAAEFADALERSSQHQEPGAVSQHGDPQEPLAEAQRTPTGNGGSSLAARLAAEPDLSVRLDILDEALRSRPNHEFLLEERNNVQTQLQQITGLVQNAEAYESAGHFDYAVEEWLCVGDIHPGYPGLQEQLARVKEAWKTAREKAIAELNSSVAAAVTQGEQDRAAGLLQSARVEFEDDPRYQRLRTLFDSAAQAHKEVPDLLSLVRKAETEGRFSDIPPIAEKAAALSGNVEPLRQKAFNTLISTASRIADRNWRAADQVLEEAAKIGSIPPELHETVSHYQREDEVRGILAQSHTHSSDLEADRQRVAALLVRYPAEPRLQDRLLIIEAALDDQRRLAERRACLAELALLHSQLSETDDHRHLYDLHDRARTSRCAVCRRSGNHRISDRHW